MNRLLLLMVALSLSGCAAVQNSTMTNPIPVSSGEHALEYANDEVVAAAYRYLLHIPEGYDHDSGEEWPVLLFLHGAGERGSDLDLVKVHGPPKLASADPSFPYIVISPQVPKNAWWISERVLATLEDVQDRLNVDDSRIYLTGLSMGGFGSWDLLIRYPERFAAVVPICGGGQDFFLRRMDDVPPIWAFHGAKDDVVPLELSQRMVDAAKYVGADVQFTVYPEADHNSWTETYANPDLYAWLDKQRRK